MNKTEKIKLITSNNRMWELAKESQGDMKMFLDQEEIPSNLSVLLYNSLRIVISELIINKNYNQYKPKVYSDEDCLDLIVNAIAEKSTGEYNKEKTKEDIEGIRKILWGHIKNYSEEMKNILSKIVMSDKNTILSEKDKIILKDCITVVYIECCVREKENIILEEEYS